MIDPLVPYACIVRTAEDEFHYQLELDEDIAGAVEAIAEVLEWPEEEVMRLFCDAELGRAVVRHMPIGESKTLVSEQRLVAG